ncbi:hypothetical protein ABPG75_004469 [Micractinium tetrahymenae]
MRQSSGRGCRHLSSLALLLLAAAAAAPHAAQACTTIIVGKNASADGSIIIARNVDIAPGVFQPQVLVHHPFRAGNGTFKSNSNKLAVALPAPGVAYHAFPLIPASQSKWGTPSFEEAGVNVYGVSISATETIMSHPKATAADPLNTQTGILEEAITSLILPNPRARTARAAAALLGELIEQIGSGEGFGVLFSDFKEAWYLENAAGHHWLAQRVPADTYFVSANQGRYGATNLSDTDNVMHSPRLAEFAIKAGLLKNASAAYTTDGLFKFFKAYQASGGFNPEVNHARVCALTKKYAGMGFDSCMAAMPTDLPVFQQPAQPLGLLDVMQGLRDHFEGTAHDAYTNQNPREPWRPIFVLHTSMGHVTRTRPSLPAALAVVHYVAMGPPGLSPFVPVYRGLTPGNYPAALTIGSATPDPVSLYWKGRRLQALVFQNFPLLAPDAKAAIAAWEQDVETVQRPAMEAAYMSALSRGRKGSAWKVLMDFTDRVVAQAGTLLDNLTAQAASKLGLPGVPSDADLLSMIKKADAKYILYGPSTQAAAASAGVASGAEVTAPDTLSWPFP